MFLRSLTTFQHCGPPPIQCYLNSFSKMIKRPELEGRMLVTSRPRLLYGTASTVIKRSDCEAGHMHGALPPPVCDTHHIWGSCELLMQEALYGQPLDGAVLVVTQTVVVCWKQVTWQGVVCYSYSQLLVHPGKYFVHVTEIISCRIHTHIYIRTVYKPN